MDVLNVKGVHTKMAPKTTFFATLYKNILVP